MVEPQALSLRTATSWKEGGRGEDRRGGREREGGEGRRREGGRE